MKEYYTFDTGVVIKNETGLFICKKHTNNRLVLSYALPNGNELKIPNEVLISNPRGLNICGIKKFSLESKRSSCFIEDDILYGVFKLDPNDKNEKPTNVLLAYPKNKENAILVLPENVNTIYKGKNDQGYAGLEKNDNLRLIIGKIDFPELKHQSNIGSALYLNYEQLKNSSEYKNVKSDFELDEKSAELLQARLKTSEYEKLNSEIMSLAFEK